MNTSFLIFIGMGLTHWGNSYAFTSLDACLNHNMVQLYNSFRKPNLSKNWQLIDSDLSKHSEQDESVLLTFYEPRLSHLGDDSALRQRFIYGMVEREEIIPGYQVYKITDEQGQIHYIDQQMQELSVYRPKEGQAVGPLSSQVNEPSMRIDRDRVKKYVCEQHKIQTQSRHYQTLNDKLKPLAGRLRRDFARHMNLPACLLNLGGLFAVNQLHHMWIDNRGKVDDPSWINLHGSNYTYGLVTMAGIHTCLRGMTTAQKNQIITLALGANVAANIYFEIDLKTESIPQVDPWANNKKTTTDKDDFSAGMAATLTYLIVAQLWENKLGSLSVLCAAN